MNNEYAKEIAQAILRVLKPATNQSKDKRVTVHFQPTDQYADSYVRSFRKGSGFLGLGAPNLQTPIDSLDIAITLKPDVMTEGWVGYTIDIKHPETNPEITLFQEWPEKGGSLTADPAKLEQLTPHILALADGSLTSDNTAAPRQAPSTMY